jgi:hypothetical protein
MNKIRELEDRRNEILEKLRLVRFLNRRTIKNSILKPIRKGKEGQFFKVLIMFCLDEKQERQ